MLKIDTQNIDQQNKRVDSLWFKKDTFFSLKINVDDFNFFIYTK